MLTYKLRKDNLFHQDIGNYTSYGIDVVDEMSGLSIYFILDISTEKKPLENLISLCNKLRLDIIHLNDVVEDFLYDFS